MSIRSFPIAAAVAVPTGAKPGTVYGPTIDLLDSETYPTDVEIEIYNQVCTATDASPGVFTWDGFPGANGDTVTIEYGAPAPFVDGGTYYVVNAATNTFDLSLTYGGAAITTTVTGTAVSLELRHNAGGSGVTTTPGYPFVPGCGVLLFLNLSNSPADITVEVQGSDDGTNWNTVASLTAAGSSILPCNGQTVDGAAHPTYQYWRYGFVGSATAAAGTLNAFLLGE